MLLATGEPSADADKRVCDKNNSLSKASSEEYPKYQYPFLLDIVFLQSALYCPFIVFFKWRRNQGFTFSAVSHFCPYVDFLYHFFTEV